MHTVVHTATAFTIPLRKQDRLLHLLLNEYWLTLLHYVYGSSIIAYLTPLNPALPAHFLRIKCGLLLLPLLIQIGYDVFDVLVRPLLI